MRGLERHMLSLEKIEITLEETNAILATLEDKFTQMESKMKSTSVTNKLQTFAKRSFGIMKGSSKDGTHVGNDIASFQLASLPLLKDLPKSAHEELLIQKLRQCHAWESYAGVPEEQIQEIILKKESTLVELNDFYLMGDRRMLSAVCYKETVDMVASNLFRPLSTPKEAVDQPSSKHDDLFSWESHWPHLELVYQFFMTFLDLVEFDAGIAKKCLSEEFLVELVNLFRSREPLEREYLKTVLHRIYYRMVSRREFIRKEMNNFLLQSISEDSSGVGVKEMLEIYGSIICGYTIPVRSEHKQLLVQVLIPLHRMKSLHTYNSQLTYCMAEFAEKDSPSATIVIKSLIKFWPIHSVEKQLMFLGEIEEILDIIDPSTFTSIQGPLFTHLSTCLSSHEDFIVERTLYYWNNERLLKLIGSNVSTIMPIIFPGLYLLCFKHRDITVLTLAYNVMKIFYDMDCKLFDELAKSCAQGMDKRKMKKE